MVSTSSSGSDHALQIGIFLPAGGENMMGGATARWSDLLAMAKRAEEVGFDFVSVLDHLVDYWEGWTLLAALAASTSRIGLVSYVTCTSYRNPALVAKMAETVDEISGGRLILGLGAGDSDSEHHIFGFDREKPVSRFEEATTIIRTLLREGAMDFYGQYYQVRNCELRPRGPRPEGPPILIGNLGGKRMLRLTVEHADIWTGALIRGDNDLEKVAPLLAEVDDACRAAGRDPSSLARMMEILVEFPGGLSDTWSDLPPISGTPNDIAAELQAYAEKGVSHLQIWIEPNTLAGIEQFAPVLDALHRKGA